MSLLELEKEKDSLTEHINIAQQYLVQYLLTFSNPLQNPSVQSTAQLVLDIGKRLEEIVVSI